MAFPEFWIVAGPNGAGKTTCVQKEPISRILPKVAFLNPDDRTLEKLLATGFQGFSDAPLGVQTPLFVESANEIFAELKNGLLHDQALGIETVLSTDKYRELVEIVEERNGLLA